MKVEVSEQTFRRLQSLAEPLVDSVEDVIVRLLDSAVAEEAEHTPAQAIDASKKRFMAGKREPLYGFRKELWELVIEKLPIEFSLDDVYKHQGVLKKLRPHVSEMEPTIRNALQRLRDMDYLEFVARGQYRRIFEPSDEPL